MMEQWQQNTTLFEQEAEHKFYINREISWLAFNERVLEEASDPQNPLLERLKFLSISASNLDEFFMIRVANLKDQVKIGYNKPDNKSGLTPREQLNAIEQRVRQMVAIQYQELHLHLLPALQEENIHVLHAACNDEQKTFAESYFLEHVFPVLTPMAIDASRPFPFLLNKTLNLAVRLEKQLAGQSEEMFAIVQVPSVLPRYIQLPTQTGQAFLLLEELIRQHITYLFPGHQVRSVDSFRITRNADLPLKEQEAEDLLEEILEELKQRKLGDAVRLEIEETMSPDVRSFLKENIEVEEEDIYTVQGPLDLTFFMEFSNLGGLERLHYPYAIPQLPQDLIGETDLFEAIAKKDILLHHPYESFDPVIRFIQSAADDPSVLAIKQTLYRVSGNSPIVAALAKAAENGKQVMVLLELKARFDEEHNITWARKLEEAGCHVIYGLVGLKTHGKITLVVRKEGNMIRRYVHLSTGNYNEKTAKLYTDIGMFTCRDEIGKDASLVFNFLSGYSDPPSLSALTIGPKGFRERILAFIETEIQTSTPDQPGYIIAKMNSLTDKEIIQALFAASKAGVKIDLIVRGICCLRPGIAGISENIRVISIVGRFLEHSRICYFKNGGDERLFLTSADWMTRNVEKRVEIVFPVKDKRLQKRIQDILSIYFSDNVKARELQPDGTYKRIRNERAPIESHVYFQQQACQAIQERKRNSMYR
ncbi:RNA degradosome polyphosphate kinase [Fodinisporobacter ferrooxydans]|uniref:Polyphosphate kinase n=1 Tax=Fodinisporobacter ferrooxydans TaxID=2901836 RepID=A0ABY4CNX8_9BACL|nr:RNA degradosome polyphosphate kinase [Alicyclobacillaceae bacterium MYW30-H2]